MLDEKLLDLLDGVRRRLRVKFPVITLEKPTNGAVDIVGVGRTSIDFEAVFERCLNVGRRMARSGGSRAVPVTNQEQQRRPQIDQVKEIHAARVKGNASRERAVLPGRIVHCKRI